MKYYRFPDNPVTKTLLALYLFAMLYLCRSSMFCLSVVGFYPSMAIILALTILLGLGFLWYQRGNWKAVFSDGRIKLAAILTAVVLVPMVVKRDWQLMYLSILLFVYISILLSYVISWRELAKYYVLTLTALAVYSILAAYVFRIPIDMGLVEKDVFRNASDFGVYNFWFAAVPRTFAKYRNFGIFREPGVYQYFLLLGLFLAQYGVRWQRERSKWIVTAILSVTMLTTFATGGVAELGLLALFVFFEQKLYRNKVLVALVAVAAVLLGIFLLYCYRARNQLWEQLYLMVVGKFVYQEDSVTERTEAIFANLDMIRHHPLVGTTLQEVLHSVANNTSSTLILLAGFGILCGSVPIFAWVALVWQKERSALANICLLVILFLSFNTQNMTWDQFFWLFPVMALAETVVPRMERSP